LVQRARQKVEEKKIKEKEGLEQEEKVDEGSQGISW
jgi:hypothetical protein